MASAIIPIGSVQTWFSKREIPAGYVQVCREWSKNVPGGDRDYHRVKLAIQKKKITGAGYLVHTNRKADLYVDRDEAFAFLSGWRPSRNGSAQCAQAEATSTVRMFSEDMGLALRLVEAIERASEAIVDMATRPACVNIEQAS